MIPPGFALDVRNATPLALPQGAVGEYGAIKKTTLPNGLYLVICDKPCAVLDIVREKFNVDENGFKLEVPVTPAFPLPMLLMRGEVSAAAHDEDAVVWFVPLVEVAELVARLRKCA